MIRAWFSKKDENTNIYISEDGNFYYITEDGPLESISNDDFIDNIGNEIEDSSDESDNWAYIYKCLYENLLESQGE